MVLLRGIPFILSSFLLLDLIAVGLVASQCDTDDLLPCDPPEVISSSVLCCNESTVCVQYSGTSVGSTANYNTSSQYCITTELVRTCTENGSWDGQTPTPSEASESQTLVDGYPTLVYMGIGFFLGGVIAAVIPTILAFLRAKKHGGVVAQRFMVLMSIMAVLVIVGLVLWFAMLGYGVSHNFSEDGGYLRRSDSSCESPSGDRSVRLGLIITCFVLANMVHSLGYFFIGFSFRAVRVFSADGTLVPFRRCGKNEGVSETDNLPLKSPPITETL